MKDCHDTCYNQTYEEIGRKRQEPGHEAGPEKLGRQWVDILHILAAWLPWHTKSMQGLQGLELRALVPVEMR